MTKKYIKCCANCEWWDYSYMVDDAPVPNGRCTRFPPMIPVIACENPCSSVYEILSTGEMLVTQPVTFSEEVCGEWTLDKTRDQYEREYYDVRWR